jgi:hypothetical protein
VDLRVGLEAVAEKKKIAPAETRIPVLQPVAQSLYCIFNKIQSKWFQYDKYD